LPYTTANSVQWQDNRTLAQPVPGAPPMEISR
jgi:hypothetical protein